MPRSINITGSNGKNYNLDTISTKDTRQNSDEALLVQIWYWNPNLPEGNPHKYPNPEKPAIGQMWLSKLITEETNPEEFKKISEA